MNPILDPNYATVWLNCATNSSCSKKLYMMDSVYGHPTDLDCGVVQIYGFYLMSYSFSGSKSYSYVVGPYATTTIIFTCGVASGTT